jgi:hypothetical protein
VRLCADKDQTGKLIRSPSVSSIRKAETQHLS